MTTSSEPPSATQTHHLRGYALATLAAASWATSGVTAKWLFSATVGSSVLRPDVAVDPATLSAARAMVSALVLFVFLAARKRETLSVRRSDIPFFAIFGVVGLAGVHFTYFQAIAHADVATAILLEYLAPILTLVYAVLFRGDRVTWVLPVGVVLSVTGCALVVGAFGDVGLAVSGAGIAWGLASAVFFAAYSILGRHAVGRYSQWTLLMYGLVSASLFWLAYQGGLGGVVRLLSTTGGVISVTYISVVGTILPFAAFLTALHHIDATRAVVTSTLEPVVAGVLAYMLLGETMGALQLLGGVLVLVAIIVVQRGSAPPAAPQPT